MAHLPEWLVKAKALDDLHLRNATKPVEEMPATKRAAKRLDNKAVEKMRAYMKKHGKLPDHIERQMKTIEVDLTKQKTESESNGT